MVRDKDYKGYITELEVLLGHSIHDDNKGKIYSYDPLSLYWTGSSVSMTYHLVPNFLFPQNNPSGVRIGNIKLVQTKLIVLNVSN